MKRRCMIYTKAIDGKWFTFAALSLLLGIWLKFFLASWLEWIHLRPPMPTPDHNHNVTLQSNAKTRETIVWSIPYPTYYINLDRNVERKQVFEHIFRDHVPIMHRISAIDPRNRTSRRSFLPDQSTFYHHHVTPKHKSADGASATGRISIGELGCILSHLQAIRTAYNDGCEAALIMEDDASTLLAPFWAYTPLDAIRDTKLANPDWTVIQLGWTSFQGLAVTKLLDEKAYSIARRVFPVPFAFGTFAYIISRRGMELMLDAYMSNRSIRSTLVNPKAQSLEYWFQLLPGVYAPVPALFATWARDTTVHIGATNSDHMSTASISNAKMLSSSIDLFYERTCDNARSEEEARLVGPLGFERKRRHWLPG